MAKPQTVTKSQLVDSVASETGIRKKDVKEVVESMLSQISDHLDDEAKVQRTGFGTFEIRERQARSGVRPGTTTRIQIPASKYPAFKPGKSLRERIRNSD